MDLYFDFIGMINDENMISLRNFIASRESQINSLTININSVGGSISSGIALYNYLKQQPFQITTHNIGEVSSAAILLYLAGTTRTAAPISKFIIHPIKMNINGDFSYTQIKEILNNVDADIKNYSKIVNNETNSLNELYDVNDYLLTDNLIFDMEAARNCHIITT